MSHVYKVQTDSRTLAYVQADSKGEARRAALAHVETKRLDAGEVIDLMRRGIGIISAKTGKLCNGDDAAGNTTVADDMEPR